MASSVAALQAVAVAQTVVINSAQAGGSKGVSTSSFLGTGLKKTSANAVLGVAAGKSRVVCMADRWAALGKDISDDQQDITRGKGMVDSLFQGAQGMGTQDAVMSSLDYINTAQRQYAFDNTKDGFYIAPAFMDKLIVHIAKNFMSLPNIKVPLILGIWGGKGQGKSFQCELAMSKIGINPICMSAGELESGNAGEPAKLIRQRYREASDIIKKGKMCCLFINDLDAGAGRMGGTTQYTVNNQMVNATLMNIADNPTNVQLPGIYNKDEIPRVPIIVTGNDFSTLYAPLIRDGRMEKFYWAPTRDDRIGVCMGIFRYDNVGDADVIKIVDTFPGQSIDFFGALRARVYDDEVRKWVSITGVENIGKMLVNAKGGPPTFDKPSMNLQKLLEYGYMLVEEQENVKRVQLADKYMREAALGDANDDSIKRGTFYGKFEAGKVDAGKVDAANVDAAKVAAAKVDAIKSDPTFVAAKLQAAKLQAARLQAAKLQAAKLQAAKLQAAKVQAAKFEAAKIRAAQFEAAKAAAVKLEKARMESSKVVDSFYGKGAQQVNMPKAPEGCTDPGAKNFDPTAQSDDGTCEYNLSARV